MTSGMVSAMFQGLGLLVLVDTLQKCHTALEDELERTRGTVAFYQKVPATERERERYIYIIPDEITWVGWVPNL